MYTAKENRYETMKYRYAGRTGLKLPAISFGLWHNFGDNADYENMKRMIFTAFDNGITHFDIANNYGPKPGAAERNFGRILKEELGAYRDELIISTKAAYDMWEGPYGEYGSRKHMLASLDQSLKRLELDYVDIFYMHRMDPDTPIEESMLALDQAVRSGKALYVGLSNFDGEHAKQATDILKELRTPFVLHQNSYSILNRQIYKNGLRKHALSSKQGIIAFKPLEQGVLTDRYLNGIPTDSRIRTDGRFLKENELEEAKMSKVRRLNDIARERGESLAQMALAWVYNDPAVTSVLIGASKVSQIEDNLKMLKSAPFTEEELSKIEELV